jgi:signal transduction histidine kinase/DNA-binding NarL/FixJ family response regulator
MTVRRLAFVLVPLVLVFLGALAALSVQVAAMQQRKIITALRHTISANVTNGDIFQLKSLVYSATRSGLLDGISIGAGKITVARDGDLAQVPSFLPISLDYSGVNIAQKVNLEDSSSTVVDVSNHFRWRSIALAAAGVVMGLLALALLAARTAARLATDLAYPLSKLARAISDTENGRHLRASLGVPYREVEDVWSRHIAVVTRLRDFLENEAEARQNAAVARMTQMMAHDVRRPFSVLRIALGMLRSTKDLRKMEHVLARVIPEVDKAIESVSGLIADVMEVGSESAELVQEPCAPESLIESTLAEMARVYPQADIKFSYQLVHAQKVGRAFSNIVSNAIQAMGLKGSIWFKTKESDGVVEFCIGNAESLIPRENIPKLFDAFFTSGKKGGTGLGLAIAHKVFAAHGGRIWCRSERTAEYPDGMVEFFFTLPVAVGFPCSWDRPLARQSAELASAFCGNDFSQSATGSGESALEDEAQLAIEPLGRPLRILIVDDEPVYRSALADQILCSASLSHKCDVGQVSGSVEFWSYANLEGTDLIITDVDLGAESSDGFDLVADLRRGGVPSFVCVHSNRVVAADYRRAMEVGADAFLPKPMGYSHLLKVILQATLRAVAARSAALVVGSSGEPAGGCNAVSAGGQPAAGGSGGEERGIGVEVCASRPCGKKVVVVDDDIFLIEAWQQALTGVAVVTYSSPTDLLVDIENGVVKATDFAAAVIDFHFSNEPTITGPMLARQLAGKGFGRIVAATDAVVESEDRSLFAEVIRKDEIVAGLNLVKVVG